MSRVFILRRSVPKKCYEEYAYVLDYLPFGYPYYVSSPRAPARRGPVAQAIGEEYFMLLELEPFRGIQLSPRERVYVGRNVADKIRVTRVVRRLTYDELTATAKAELPAVLETIVESKEDFFVDFFNNAEPLTKKMHELELLRGIGKKTLWRILEERKKKPFESFKDIQARAKIPDPKKLIVERIIEELRGGQKYYLFVVPALPHRESGARFT